VKRLGSYWPWIVGMVLTSIVLTFHLFDLDWVNNVISFITQMVLLLTAFQIWWHRRDIRFIMNKWREADASENDITITRTRVYQGRLLIRKTTSEDTQRSLAQLRDAFDSVLYAFRHHGPQRILQFPSAEIAWRVREELITAYTGELAAEIHMQATAGVVDEVTDVLALTGHHRLRLHIVSLKELLYFIENISSIVLGEQREKYMRRRITLEEMAIAYLMTTRDRKALRQFLQALSTIEYPDIDPMMRKKREGALEELRQEVESGVYGDARRAFLFVEVPRGDWRQRLAEKMRQAGTN
jgi:hypothetical protein